MKARFLLSTLCVMFVSALASEAPAEEPDRTVQSGLTERQEDDALEFAGEHHPELAKLLRQLRRNSPVGFSRGIREIHVSRQRLERLRDRQPERFEAELENWKRDSQIRLLTARWVMVQDPELEKKIVSLLRERQAGRRARLVAERERLLARLKQLDASLSMNSDALEAEVSAEWNRLAKRATTATRMQRRPAKKSKPVRQNENSRPEE